MSCTGYTRRLLTAPSLLALVLTLVIWVPSANADEWEECQVGCDVPVVLTDDDLAHPDAAYVYALDEPPLEIPLAMARSIAPVVVCEINGYYRIPYYDLSSIISPTNDYGQFQLNLSHAEKMSFYDLDFFSERDRLIYVRALWSWHGWYPWSCAR